jgi:general stress protein 26
MDDQHSGRGKLWGLIKKHKFAMMTTSHEGNALRSRPMTTIDRDFDDTLWFFARADSIVAGDLARQPQVCLSYAESSGPDFVCVAGPAEVVTDVAKKKDLWNASVDAWMPEGADSPAVVLLKVSPNHAEYWDSKSSKLVQLFSMAKALATGKPPEQVGEHRHIPIDAGKSSARS